MSLLEEPSTTPAPWQNTLHLEVRSKGLPGRPNVERRVYSMVTPADPEHPNEATLHMIHAYSQNGYDHQSIMTWTPAESDPALRTAVFRESVRASDPLLGKLERYGWVRKVQL